MELNFIFSENGEKNKKDCEILLSQSNNIGCDYKNNLKSIMGGQDKGFHKWHQIYDVIYFLNELKFPRTWLKILLKRGQNDDDFKRNFLILLESWVKILNCYNSKQFEVCYHNELKIVKKKIGLEKSNKLNF